VRKEISSQHPAKVISSQLPAKVISSQLSAKMISSQTIHTWSDRTSNYFVSGEDDI
jgi:hypothetical protein